MIIQHRRSIVRILVAAAFVGCPLLIPAMKFMTGDISPDTYRPLQPNRLAIERLSNLFASGAISFDQFDMAMSQVSHPVVIRDDHGTVIPDVTGDASSSVLPGGSGGSGSPGSGGSSSSSGSSGAPSFLNFQLWHDPATGQSVDSNGFRYYQIYYALPEGYSCASLQSTMASHTGTVSLAHSSDSSATVSFEGAASTGGNACQINVRAPAGTGSISLSFVYSLYGTCPQEGCSPGSPSDHGSLGDDITVSF